MNSKIIASFIVPVYNTAPFLLERCIESIINNTKNNIEIIIVNDGSTEKSTNDKCNDIYNNNNLVKYFVQENQGVSVARNIGIENSQGKYIFFVDPDDYINDDIISLLEQLDEEESDIIVLECYRETNDGKKVKIDLGNESEQLDKKELINNTLFCGTKYPQYYGGAVWAKAFKKSFLINKSLKFNPELRKAQDRVFMLYSYSEADSIKYKKILSYVYFQNFDSICNKYNRNAIQRSHSFYNAVETFLNSTKLDLNISKLLSMVSYLSYFEILYLNLFNFENKNKRKDNLSMARKEYKSLKISNAVKILKVKEFNSLSEKIKFFLIKYKLLSLLNIFICRRQSNARIK